MENNPQPIPVSSAREIKNYSIAWFAHNSVATDEIYLIDKVQQKIWLYVMNHPAKDVTTMIRRRYEADKNKPWMQQRIGGELFTIMDNQDVPLHWAKVIGHSNSAKEITRKMYEARLLQAELRVKICQNPAQWVNDETAAKYFGDI